MDLRLTKGDPEGVADNLIDYIEHFSPNVRDVFDGFGLIDEIARLAKSDRLYLIVKEFAAVDLHPTVISGHDMGYIFEELIRKFADSNATQAGDHFTPREVIALMVDILFDAEDDALTKPGIVRTIYDPAAGTGGMLSTAFDHLVEMNPKARPVLYGQAALLGLIGVLVGALLTVILQYLLGVRNEYAAATVAARLIIAELNGLVEVVQCGDFDDSGLLETPAWNKQQAALAIVLPTTHWDAVERAYTKFAAVRSRPQQPVLQEQQMQFLRAAQRAREVLTADMRTRGPLRGRGSPIEWMMPHWPEVDDPGDGG